MAFRLYGSQDSTHTRRVAMIAKERNIPYELILVDLAKGEHKHPGHLEHQPFGEVPYIVVRHLSSPSLLFLESCAAFSQSLPPPVIY